MKRNKLYSLLTAILLVCTLFLSVSLTACKPKDPANSSGDSSAKVTVTGITLDTKDVKKTFDFAEAFTCEGLKVTAQMSDKTTKNVDLKDCKISEPDTSRAGKRNVMVAYEGKTATYQVTVNKRIYPEITKEALLEITGENDSVAYRVEAENIDMAVSSVKKQNSATNFVAQSPLDAEITSGNAYLTNYGVKYNYFGFKFTSDKAYEGVTIVFRLAYSGSDALSLDDNFEVVLNRTETDDGIEGIMPFKGYNVFGGTCVWSDVVLRNQKIKEGENVMTFEALSDKVPDIDYIDFYVGKRYISSIVEMTEETEYVKEIEDFDTEKAKTREDVAKAHNLKDGELFVETVTKESEGKTTSGGKSVGALTKGSQLSTTLRLAQKATVKITFIASKVADYKVKNNWKFAIDGVQLENIEDVNIKGGNASKGEWWDWNPTTLGVYNLPAGDHLFLIEVSGSDCNVDCMKFEVISLGEYDESGVGVGEHFCASKCEKCGKCKNDKCTEEVCKEKCECLPDVFDATLSSETTVRVEAENLDTSKWVHQAGVADFTEEWNNDFGSGVCAKGIGSGTVITVYVDVKMPCTLSLGMVMSYYGAETYNFDVMKLDDAVLTATPAGPFGHREAGDYWKWVDVSLGSVKVNTGVHILSVKICNVNIDYFYFTATEAGEIGEHICMSKCGTCGKCKNADCTEEACLEKCECVPETFDVTVTGAGTVKAEAEDLDTANWVHQDGVPSFTEEWNNDFGKGVCARGLGAGTVITVKVKVDKKCIIALGMVMSYYGADTYNFDPDMKFGETLLTATPAGAFGHREAGDYWKWVDVSLGRVEVEAGEYVLSVKISNVNIDYFYFTVLDGTVANTGVTTIEMENLTDMDVKTSPDFVAANRVEDGKFAVDTTDTASNSQAICGFTSGTVFTVNFFVTEAGTYKISLVGANGNDYPISNMTFMLDGKELTGLSGNLVGTTHDGIPSYWDWQTIELSSSALTAGAHKLTIKINSGAPNLDCVKIEAVTASAAE